MAVLQAMSAHGDFEEVQHSGCLALQALQPLLRHRLCGLVEAAAAKFPGIMDAKTTAATIGAISGALASTEPALATAEA